MTVRDFIQTLILECPDMDAKVYIHKWIDEIEVKNYVISKITNDGTNDALFIEINDWQPRKPI